MNVQFRIEAAGLIQKAKHLSASMQTAQRPTREICLRLISRARARLQGRPPAKMQPQVRTGLLARSLYSRPSSNTGAVVASQLSYARIQQEGGVVVPTGGRKCLAIPLVAALKRNGIWPRDWPKGALTFIPLRKGNAVGMLVGAAMKSPAGKAKKRTAGRRKEKLIAQYLLVRQATIPLQPYVVWDAEMAADARLFWARHLKGASVV